MGTRQRRIAIVGAGPSGLFAAQALVGQDRVPVAVDLIERLPTPFGLLRYGVAPDHENIKAVGDALARTFDRGDVGFWGLVEFGRDVTRAELLDAYDAVIYAVGAAQDVELGIPGEDLEGSRSAREFVAWYGGHPDAIAQDLSGVTGVATIGVGNVAVDVARVLLKDPEELDKTDMPPAVLAELHRATVREVWIVGRRGPQHASYTTKELRELVNLPGLQVTVSDGAFAGLPGYEELEGPGAGIEPAPDDPAPAFDRRVRGNLEVLAEAAAREVPDATRWLHFDFWSRPVRMEEANGRLDELILEDTRLDASGRVTGTGRFESLPVQLVLRSIGYRATPLPGVPFDTTAAVLPNVQGRVVDVDGVLQPREYCVGWVKRGPIGVIGTNKSDAAQTVSHLLDDLEREQAQGVTRELRTDLREVLRARGHAPSTLADWRAIDAAEIARGADLGRTRTKLATWNELLDHVKPANRHVETGEVCGGPESAAVAGVGSRTD